LFYIPLGKKIASFTKHTDIVPATYISPNGRSAVTEGADNQEINLWDLTIGQIKQKMVGKGGRI
jgi:WD40 repeat protein